MCTRPPAVRPHARPTHARAALTLGAVASSSWQVGAEVSINAVAFLPSNADHLVVCNRSPHIYVMSLGGDVVQTLDGGKREGGDFVACAVSTKVRLSLSLSKTPRRRRLTPSDAF